MAKTRKMHKEDQHSIRSGIDDDVIAEALRSVEKHRKIAAERQSPGVDEPLLNDETQEIILDADEIFSDMADWDGEDVETSAEKDTLSRMSSLKTEVSKNRSGADKVRIKKDAAKRLIAHLKTQVKALSQEKLELETLLEEKTLEAKKII